MPTFLQEERRRPRLGTGGFVPKRWIARAGQAGGDDTRRQGTVDLENHLGQGFETTMIKRGLAASAYDCKYRPLMVAITFSYIFILICFLHTHKKNKIKIKIKKASAKGENFYSVQTRQTPTLLLGGSGLSRGVRLAGRALLLLLQENCDAGKNKRQTAGE